MGAGVFEHEVNKPGTIAVAAAAIAVVLVNFRLVIRFLTAIYRNLMVYDLYITN